MQAPRSAAGATVHVETRHPDHESFNRLHDPRVDGWHLKCQTRGPQLDRLAARSEHPVVANALKTAGQNMRQDAAYELHAWQPHGAFSPMRIGPDLEGNFALADR